MVSKLIKVEDGLLLSLPPVAVAALGLREGSELSVEVNTTGQQLTLTPTRPALHDVDAEFAQQLAEFIAHYRPALKALAR